MKTESKLFTILSLLAVLLAVAPMQLAYTAGILHAKPGATHDGFTSTAGSANGASDINGYGGGMVNNAGSSTLTWNTFLGSTVSDWNGHATAVDVDGNVYVGGYSSAAWTCSPAPCTVRAYKAGNNGFENGFVAKLNSSGVLLWNTFLGGGGYIQRSYDIALDGSNYIYVVGWSGGEWGSCEPACPTGGTQAYVAKLNAVDGVLQWVSFFENSSGYAVALDDAGNIYMAGKSLETRDCTPSCTRRPHAGSWDGLVVKLNSDGVMQWNTYLGAAGSIVEDSATAIAVDVHGNIYVEGISDHTWETPVRPISGGQDAFTAKLNSDGVLLWNTFLGGSGDEEGWNETYGGIAADEDGNVYVVGDSTVAWSCSPVACTIRAFTPGSPFEAADAYAAKLNSSGVLQWNTFLGGDMDDAGNDLALDGAGNVYLAGTSGDTWGNPQRAFVNGDGYAAKLNSSGALQWNTFLGGKGDDRGNGIALDVSGGVYITGTGGSWGAPVRAYSGSSDVFAAKIPPPPVTITNLLKSIPTQDGWTLEASENSKVGGTLDSAAATLRLGDNNLKKQYRSILSFPTGAALPDNAVITKVTLKVKKHSITGGGNPVAAFQGFKVDIKKGILGTAALQITDFQTPANKTIGPFTPTAVANLYSINLTSGKAAINKDADYFNGLTQIRLYFKLDDNNNAVANFMSFYSGNAPAASRPQLVIEYYLP